jgi:hypothetical protein
MRHLWKNMKKYYYGPLFSQNMWATAKCFTIEKYNYHMGKIEEKAPYALAWLDDNHPFVWTRSKFSEESLVDYINNNLSECFNSWISKVKDQQIVNMLDKIRTMLITKFVDRYKISSTMVGTIIPSIIEKLNATNKEIKDHEVLIVVGVIAEVNVSVKNQLQRLLITMVNSEAQWASVPSGPKVNSVFIFKPRCGGCCSSSSPPKGVTGVEPPCSPIHSCVHV